MGEQVGGEDLQQVALAYERQRGSATSYRTSKITQELEVVKERRRIVESRAAYCSGGVLWAREIAAEQKRHRQAEEAAKERNRQLQEEVKSVMEELKAHASNPLRRASRAQVDTARKQYLDAVEALYPQWCRQVEAAAAESNQRLGNSLVEVQKKRSLAAERFAKQMVARTKVASREQDLRRARAVGHVEQVERETQLRAADAKENENVGQAVIDAASIISALKDNSAQGSGTHRFTHVEELLGEALGDSELRDGIHRLSAYLQQLSRKSGLQDPDMPPDHPPVSHEGGRLGSSGHRELGHGQHVAASGLSAVPMEVYTPDGKQQTVMVPVLGASFAGSDRAEGRGRMEVNPSLLKHLSTPKGGAVTPVRRSADSTASGSSFPPWRRDAPAAAAAKLKQQMLPSGQFPARYQNNSAEVSPGTSVDATPHTSLDWTGKDMPGQLDPTRDTSTSYQDYTLADHINAAGSPGSEGKSNAEMSFLTSITPAKPTRTTSNRDSQEDSVVYTYALQSPPPQKRRPARAASSRESSAETSQEFSPTFPVVSSSVAGSVRGSDHGGLSAEPSNMSAAPSLMGMGGGTLSPASSQDAADWTVRSSVESKARSSHGKSPLGALGDSILSDLTEDSIDEEQLAEEREEWNRKEQQRKESVQRELEQAKTSRPPSPSSRPGTPVIQGAGANRGSRPLYRASSSPVPSNAGSQPGVVRPSTSGSSKPSQQAKPASSGKTRPLGVFGFGGGLGGGDGGSDPPNNSMLAARGSGGSLMAMSSIVSKAFDDDGSGSEGSEADYRAGSNFLRASSSSVAPQPATRVSSFNPLSRSQSIGSHVNETSDEFDF